jgi:hypothetical protein
MKKFITILVLLAFMFPGFSQQNENENDQNNDMYVCSDTNDHTKIVIGNDYIIVEDGNDEVNIRIGNRGLSILESLEGPDISLKKYDYNSCRKQDYYDDRKTSRRARRFKGHWTGVELGFNNYLSTDNSLVLPAEIDYMSLHSGKSINFNINFTQLSMGITRHIGFVTGLGLNWNNYKFDGNNNIFKGANGIIEILDPGSNLEKSKLATLFLTLPFMMEFQIPANNGRLNIGAGPIGAIKIASHNKMVFENGEKLKSNGDFSLNILRYGATARAGYNNFQIYGTCYKTPLFRNGKGPAGYDLYPFEIGVALTFNH